MGFKEVLTLDADKAHALGGNDKNGKPNPKRIEGFFLGSTDKKSEMSKTGLCKFHVFQTKEGKVGVWGKTDIDRKLLAATPGAMTRVTFTGMGLPKPGKKPMYLFKVEQDLENTIDVSGVNQSEESSEQENYEEETPTDEGFSEEEPEDETGLDEEEPPVDEAPPVRAAPKKVAAPTAASQKKIQDLMKSRKSA